MIKFVENSNIGSNCGYNDPLRILYLSNIQLILVNNTYHDAPFYFISDLFRPPFSRVYFEYILGLMIINVMVINTL